MPTLCNIASLLSYPGIPPIHIIIYVYVIFHIHIINSRLQYDVNPVSTHGEMNSLYKHHQRILRISHLSLLEIRLIWRRADGWSLLNGLPTGVNRRAIFHSEIYLSCLIYHGNICAEWHFCIVQLRNVSEGSYQRRTSFPSCMQECARTGERSGYVRQKINPYRLAYMD